MLASVSPQHIAAIVVPMHLIGTDDSNLQPERYRARIALQAALVGLDHLANGIDLPVVTYDIDHPQAATKIHYLGQGRAELTQLGLQALSALSPADFAAIKHDIIDVDLTEEEIQQENNKVPGSISEQPYEILLAQVQKHLNIDITLPAEGPNGWIARAADMAALIEATRGPAPQSHRTSPASVARC